MRHKAHNTARLQALDDELVEIPWVGLAHTSGSPIVVPDTVQMHARDSRSYATPLELQQVRSRARAREHTLLLAHMHTRGRHAAPAGLMTPTTFEPCSGIGVGPPAAAA